MMIGISTHLYAMWPLEPRFLDMICEAGFDAVELWGMAPHIEIEKEGSLARAGQWARDAGLEVASVHLPFYRRWGSPDFKYLAIGDPKREDARLASDLAGRVLDETPNLGTEIAVLHGVAEVGGDDDQSRRLYEQDLLPILDRAQKLNVTLAVENIMTRLSSSWEIAALIDRVNSPRLRACLDLGHAHITEDVDGAIQKLGDRMVTTHLQDNCKDGDDHLIPGDGTIDWPSAVKGLKEIDDPGLIFEIFGPAAGRCVDEEVFSLHLKKTYGAAVRYFGI